MGGACVFVQLLSPTGRTQLAALLVHGEQLPIDSVNNSDFFKTSTAADTLRLYVFGCHGLTGSSFGGGGACWEESIIHWSAPQHCLPFATICFASACCFPNRAEPFNFP
jgi:hypothetical protein